MSTRFRRAEKILMSFWCALILQCAAAVGLVLLAPKVEAPSNTAEYVMWVVLAIMCVALPLIMTEIRRRVARDETVALAEMSAEHLAMISGYVDPALGILRKFTTAATKDDLSGLEGSYRSKLVECAHHVCGPRGEDVRALLFMRSGQTLSQALRSGGTRDSPRKFTNRPSDPAGHEAWELAQKGRPKLYEDVRKRAPEHYESPEDREYLTFITCGILDQSDKVRAMLNVDARDVNSLTKEDKKIVSHLATLISAGIDVADVLRPHLPPFEVE